MIEISRVLLYDTISVLTGLLSLLYVPWCLWLLIFAFKMFLSAHLWFLYTSSQIGYVQSYNIWSGASNVEVEYHIR